MAYSRCGGVCALALLALVGLTAREAQAAWTCEVVDGPSSTWPGAWNDGATSTVPGTAIVWNGKMLPIYAATDTGESIIRFGTSSADPSNHSWSLTSLGSIGVMSPGALNVGGTVWTAAAVSDDSRLLVGHSAAGPVLNTSLDAGGGQPGRSAIVSYGGNVWVFYESHEYVDGEGDYVDYIRYVYNDGTHWSGPWTLTGNAKAPAPVVFNNSLYVFYYDTGGYLAQMTWNGGWWSSEAYVDGDAFISGQTWDMVGQNASTLVDTTQTPNVLRVFYRDDTAHSLRTASLASGSGSAWSYATVDGGGGGDVGLYSAPVMQGSIPQVYYLDSANSTIKGASLMSGSWTYIATIDGDTSSGSLCDQQGGGGTPDALGGPISVVSFGGGPHLFYGDVDTGDVRTAFWF